MFPGGKGGWCVGLTTLPPEIWDPQPPGTNRACRGLQWDWLTFTLHNLRTLSDATVAAGLTSSRVRHVVIADCMHLGCLK
jgi:hypothetical protein